MQPDTFVFMALDPSLDRVGGKFFADKHQIESSPESHDLSKAKRFWELASQLTGLNRDRPPGTGPRAAPAQRAGTAANGHRQIGHRRHSA